MYLKSIEVQGFKSFANKLVFEFHNGITCIVGPNGSGKSNVADAVRWVLGEQSAKQLRGSNMQDVIFSGTEARKPLGFASVSITLDNSDHKLNINYDEVTVTRKVFRSGESEYKLNGVNCRLRDIYELFYDTGIGKEGYSIIGQGQIERILSNKPEERRELFDEAVGIVKYKRRKQSTLKKLESEHANLTRVSDILSELEKQVGPLKRQSETAKKYLSIRDELKKYDLQLFRVFTDRSEEDLKKIEENDAIVCGDLEDTKKALDELTSAYEEVDTFIRSLDEQSASLSEQMTEKLNRKNEISSNVLLLNEQIASEEKNRGTLNERLEQIRTQLLSMEEEKNGYLTQKTELVRKLEEQKKNETELTAKMRALDDSIAENMVLVEKDQDELKKLLNSKSDVVAKLQHFDTLYEQVSRRRSEISSKRLQSQSELETAQENRKGFADQLSKVRDNVTSYRQKFQELKDKQQGLVKNRDEIAAEKDELLEQFHEASSRAASLKNLEEHFEGYQNSIRKLMEHKQSGAANMSGIEGV
ncbi:MAG: AAA family ATPase, partial [Lachnospiraceae bacterium]|nr:AAA family ATPase [Lachnospiraceae bacterium]